MMSRSFAAACAAIAVGVTAHTVVVPAERQETQVRFVTEDLDRFAKVLPAALTVTDTAARAALLQRDYIDGGTAGFQDFVKQGRLTAQSLATAIERTPKFFAWMAGEYPRRLQRQLPDLRRSIERVRDMYPAARLPEIVFLVGHFRSSGTVANGRMLLGAEVFSVQPDTPVAEFAPERRGIISPMPLLTYNTVHEFVHLQQKWEGKESLLQRAIIEGTAELVASLVVPAAPVPVNHEFAASRAASIWKRFAAAMHGTDTTEWLANNHLATPDWPAAMGYNVGFHVAKGYYDKQNDKTAALRTLFALEDAAAILRESGYAGQFSSAGKP